MAQAEEIRFKEFRERFATEDACRAELFRLRFAEGFVCPKCGGTEILRIDGRSVIGGVIPAGWTGAKLNRFLCTVCGYSEEWIDPADIPALRERYGK